MREQEHNYEVCPLENGFEILPRDEKRPPVVAILYPDGFWKIGDDTNMRIPTYHFYYLLEKIVDKLYETWEPPVKSDNLARELAIEIWAKKVTGKTLNKKVHDNWKRCMALLDPEIYELHRKLYSVNQGRCYWGRIEEILADKEQYKYLIKDMLNYKAARIAVLLADDFDTIKSDWKKVYAFDYEVYGSLRKTLTHLPNNITYWYLFFLQNIILPEPVTGRIKLWAYCFVAKKAYNSTRWSKEHDTWREYNDVLPYLNVIKRSTDEDVREAIRYIWHYFPAVYTGDFRKKNGIEHAFNMIFDYPVEDIGEWDIIGLAKRAEKWHHETNVRRAAEEKRREEERMKRDKEYAEYRKKLETSATAYPLVSLPRNEHIRFLDTYTSVKEEGALMGHCIASYAEHAVKGYCYLFHVDYEGDMASVEVNPSGYVVQAYGPRDTVNKASVYGKRVLANWARKLQENTQPVIPMNVSAYVNTNIYEEVGEIPF